MAKDKDIDRDAMFTSIALLSHGGDRERHNRVMARLAQTRPQRLNGERDEPAGDAAAEDEVDGSSSTRR